MFFETARPLLNMIPMMLLRLPSIIALSSLTLATLACSDNMEVEPRSGPLDQAATVDGGATVVGVPPADPQRAESQAARAPPPPDCENIGMRAEQPARWDAKPIDDSESEYETLLTLVSGMTGSWQGWRVVPEGWQDGDARASVRFNDDGTYYAHCLDQSMECCLSFYAGSDRVFPERSRHFEIDEINTLRRGSGSIEVFFDYNGEPGLPAWQGELANVELDASGDRLRFDFNTSDGYGPVHFDLYRSED